MASVFSDLPELQSVGMRKLVLRKKAKYFGIPCLSVWSLDGSQNGQEFPCQVAKSQRFHEAIAKYASEKSPTSSRVAGVTTMA